VFVCRSVGKTKLIAPTSSKLKPIRLPSVALRCPNEGQRGPLEVRLVSPVVFNEFHTSKYLVTSQTMLYGNRNFEVSYLKIWSGRWDSNLTASSFPSCHSIENCIQMRRKRVRNAMRTGNSDQRVALPITDRLQLWSVWRAKSANVPHRRLAEEAVVFAIKLTGALVPDLKRGTCSI